MDKTAAVCELYSVGTQYYDYLLGSNQVFLLNNPANLRILKILFTSFRYILKREKIKTSDEVKDGYLSREDLEKFLSKITIKTPEGKYLLDKIEFNTIEEVLKAIRDKMAHGAFLYDETAENIILDINGQEAKINVDAFLEFSMLLFSGYDYLKEEKEYTRRIYCADKTKQEPLQEENKIDDFLKKQKIIEMKFLKVKGKLKSKDKVVIESLIRSIGNSINNNEFYPSLSNYDKTLKKYLPKDIKYEIKEISLLKSRVYKQVKRYIIKGFDIFKTMDFEIQSNAIGCFTEKAYDVDFLNRGIHHNTMIVEEMGKTGVNKSFKNLLIAKNSTNLFNDYIEMLATTLLTKFYALYHYPLENICRIKDNVENGDDYFDYDKLDLSMVKPTIFKLPEKKLSDIENRIESTINNIDKLLIAIPLQRKDVEKKHELMEKETDPNKKIGYGKGYEIALQVLDKKILTYLELSERLTQLKNKYDELTGKTDNYYRNRFLIEYMRNAISHGNVTLDYVNGYGEFNNTNLRFINEYEGVVYLDLTISLADFEDLFKMENLKVMTDFINKKETCILIK